MSLKSRLDNLQRAILRLDGARYLLLAANPSLARMVMGEASTSLASARRDLLGTEFEAKLRDEQMRLGALIDDLETFIFNRLFEPSAPLTADIAKRVEGELSNMINRLITILKQAYAT